MKIDEKQVKELWQFIQEQDETLKLKKSALIIKAYDSNSKADRYVIAEMKNGMLNISVSSVLTQEITNKPFVLIQHRNSKGRLIIPDVTQMNRDRIEDY